MQNSIFVQFTPFGTPVYERGNTSHHLVKQLTKASWQLVSPTCERRRFRRALASVVCFRPTIERHGWNITRKRREKKSVVTRNHNIQKPPKPVTLAIEKETNHATVHHRGNSRHDGHCANLLIVTSRDSPHRHETRTPQFRHSCTRCCESIFFT